MTAPRVSLGAHHKLVFAYLILVPTPNQRHDEIQTREALQTGIAQFLGDAQSKGSMFASLKRVVLHESAVGFAKSRNRLSEAAPRLRPPTHLDVYQHLCTRLVPAHHKQQRLYARAQRDAEAHLPILKVAF